MTDEPNSAAVTAARLTAADIVRRFTYGGVVTLAPEGQIAEAVAQALVEAFNTGRMERTSARLKDPVQRFHTFVTRLSACDECGLDTDGQDMVVLCLPCAATLQRKVP